MNRSWWTPPDLASHVANLLLIVAFAAAASYKVVHFDEFVLSGSALLPGWLPDRARHMALISVPLLEGAIIPMLLFARWRAAGAFLSTGLIAIFTLALASVYADGQLGITCSCHWFSDSKLAPHSIRALLARNGVLFALSLAVLFRQFARPAEVSALPCRRYRER